MFFARLMLSVVGVVLWAPASWAALPPIESYGKLPRVEDISLSTSGQRYALIGVDGETRKLTVSTTDGLVLYSINVGAAKVRRVDWADEDHVLVTVTGTVNLGPSFILEKQEFSNVIAINVATKKIVSVFDKHPRVAPVVLGQYGTARIGGHSYGYFGGLTFADRFEVQGYIDHTYADLYRVDLDTGDLMRVAKGSDNIDGWIIGSEGDVIARSQYDESDRRWQVLSGGSGGRLLASGQWDFGGVSLQGRGLTPATIIVRRPTDDGDVDEELPLEGGKATELPNDKAIANLLFDRTTGLWIGYTDIGDVPEPKMLDPLTEAKVRGARKAFPEQSVRLDSWSTDFNRMIVFTSGGDDSGTYWIIDIAKHAAHPIGYEYPDAQPADVGPVRMVEWKASDGLTIHGVLSLPPGQDPHNLPLVVLPHGGPWARDYPTFDWWAQAFASRGYAVFQPNFRGSTGYGDDFYKAGFGQMGARMQTDISDGVSALARQGVVDPKRACIVGGSYGGYAALAGVTLQHGLYRCAVSVAGLSNLPGFLSYIADKSGYDSSARRFWKAFAGTTSTKTLDLNTISPAYLARQADAPILLIHGKDDTRVPIDQSQQMERALRAAGRPVEFIVLPDEDHFLSREATRITMLKSAVEFVEKYNPSDVAK